MYKGLKHITYEEGLRELGLCSLEKAQGNVISIYLEGGCKEDRARLFSVAPSHTRGTH